MEQFKAKQEKTPDAKIEKREGMPLTPITAALLVALGSATLAETASAQERVPPPGQIGAVQQVQHAQEDIWARLAKKTIEGLQQHHVDQKIGMIVSAGLNQALETAASGKQDPTVTKDLQEAGGQVAQDAIASLLGAAIPELARVQKSLERHGSE